MTDRNPTPAELDEYVQSLPAAERPARDLSARRQRLLPVLRAHAAREHGRARRRRLMVRAAGVAALASAAAVAALWIGVPSRRPTAMAVPAPAKAATAAPVHAPVALTVLDGAVLMESAGIARTLHSGDSIDLATVGALEAPADRAVSVRLSEIVGVTLDPTARVRPIATGTGAAAALEVLALERGRAHFQVEKLGDARRFHVLTPDADIEVRGTTFDVALRPGATPQTCVSVSEGLVLVASGMSSRLLEAGEKWGCDAGGGEKSESRTRTRTRTGTRTGTGTGTGTKGVEEAAAVDTSDLREQNRLFQTALGAERAGRIDDARRNYRELLARAPDGPLAAQVRANLEALAGTQR